MKRWSNLQIARLLEVCRHSRPSMASTKKSRSTRLVYAQLKTLKYQRSTLQRPLLLLPNSPLSVLSSHWLHDAQMLAVEAGMLEIVSWQSGGLMSFPILKDLVDLCHLSLNRFSLVRTIDLFRPMGSRGCRRLRRALLLEREHYLCCWFARPVP